MDCNTFRKLIPAYINRELNDTVLNEFLLHLRSCSQCQEELEIHYIVMKGVDILDNDTNRNYNLSDAFHTMISESRRYIGKRKRRMRCIYVIDTLVLWTVIASMFLFFNLYFPG